MRSNAETFSVKLTHAPKGAALRSIPYISPEIAAVIKDREEQAFERGRRQAEEALTGQIVSQRNEMMQLQNGVLKALQASIPNVVRETEQTLIELALTTAERLVSGLPVNAEAVEASIREVLGQIEETTDVQVLLHADDVALLRREGSEFAADTPSQRLRLVASADVSRGGCVVRTHFGDIDGRRETKLAQVRKAVLE
ncbi:MAG TPA: hypothetical protein DCY13_07170 [Verrucomicrobiales bacterium]|nr:hypothetical protein [Verrucomicrobiales bacterium]